LPFCVPLLLLGYLVDALHDRRERRRDSEREARARQAWRDTWFRHHGAPSLAVHDEPRAASRLGDGPTAGR